MARSVPTQVTLVNISTETIPFTSGWFNVHPFTEHSFEINRSGTGVTAASVRIEAQIDVDGTDVVPVGQTDTTPLTLESAGDSQLHLSQQSFRRVRAVVTALTRTANSLTVTYLGR